MSDAVTEWEHCYWCGSKDHQPKDCTTSITEKIRRCYQAVARPLIEGDYIGPLRGEVNVCLNVIHFYQAYLEASKQLLPKDQLREIRELAYKIRREKYGNLLW